jgi:hypothetical protein
MTTINLSAWQLKMSATEEAMAEWADKCRKFNAHISVVGRPAIRREMGHSSWFYGTQGVYSIHVDVDLPRHERNAEIAIAFQLIAANIDPLEG